jgi:hypothetical protein
LYNDFIAIKEYGYKDSEVDDVIQIALEEWVKTKRSELGLYGNAD